MSTTKVIVLLVALLGLVSAQEGLSRSHQYHGKHLVFDGDSFENTTLAYAVCDQPGKDLSERNCTVVLETSVLQGTTKTVTCELTLKTQRAEHEIGQNMKVFPLVANRTILVWTESDKRQEGQSKQTIVRYSTVKLPECEISETNLTYVRADDAHPEMAKVLTYHNGNYDLVFHNESLCGQKSFCNLHVEPLANRVGQVKKWFTHELPVTDIVPVMPHTPDVGHLVVEDTPNGPRLYMIMPNLTRKNFEFEKDGPWKVAYSVSNSLVGLCYYSNSSMNCDQYDSKILDHRLQTNPEFDYDLKQVAVHNLRDGGFLLLTSRCDSTCATNDDHYYVTKFNAEGKKVGELHLTGFHRQGLDNAVNIQFFEIENDGLYCVSVIRYDVATKDSMSMLLFAKCFDDKHFK